MNGTTFRRCGCRDENGRQLGAACPQLGSRRHRTWYLVLPLPYSSGRRKQVKRGGFATKADAEAELQRLRTRLARGGDPTQERQTTGDWLSFWLAEKTKASGASAVGKPIRRSTALVYSQHVENYLIPELGHVPLVALRAEHIAAAYDHIQAARPGMGAATLRRVHACLRASLNAAIKAGRIDVNPAIRVWLPAERTPRVRPWEPAELGLFLDYTAGHRLGPLFEFMAFTGLRRGEALGLCWADVDLEHAVIVVRRQ